MCANQKKPANKPANRRVDKAAKDRKDQYIAALVGADQPRKGDADGRGNLSESGLAAFCQFFLQTALDQIRFMTIRSPGLERRITKYVERRAAFGLPEEAKYILVEVLTHGEIVRGEVPRITGKPERTARRILDETLKQGLVSPTTPKDQSAWPSPRKPCLITFQSSIPKASKLRFWKSPSRIEKA